MAGAVSHNLNVYIIVENIKKTLSRYWNQRKGTTIKNCFYDC